jgi:hypothetical protein
MALFTRSREQLIPIAHEVEQMWQLVGNSRLVRLSLPDLPVGGVAEPIRVNIDFDARVVDKMIERLTVLRAQMLPAPPAPSGTEVASVTVRSQALELSACLMRFEDDDWQGAHTGGRGRDASGQRTVPFVDGCRLRTNRTVGNGR